MHLTHGTLRGLTLHLQPVAPVFAGEPAVLDVVLTSPAHARASASACSRARRAGVDAGLDRRAGAAAGDGARQLRAGRARPARRADAARRDALSARPVPRLDGVAAGRAACSSTRSPRAMPPRRCRRRGRCRAAPTPARSADGGEIEGVRAYRRGDPLKLVAWKKAAQGARDRRRAGQPRHQRVGAPRALARLAPRAPAWRPKSGCRAWPPGCSRPTAPAPTTACACPASSSRPAHGEAQRRAA